MHGCVLLKVLVYYINGYNVNELVCVCVCYHIQVCIYALHVSVVYV